MEDYSKKHPVKKRGFGGFGTGRGACVKSETRGFKDDMPYV